MSFGPGVLYLCAITSTPGVVTEATDLVDIGGVNSGGTLNLTRSALEVNQGSPAARVATFVTQETAQLSVTGIEWDLGNLALALGAGVVDEISDPQTFGFGGSMNITNVAVKFVHEMHTGQTLSIRFWSAESDGNMSVTFGDQIHEIPYTFNALETSTGWDSTALAATERLCQISIDG